MKNIDLQKLKELAQKATQGPWIRNGFNVSDTRYLLLVADTYVEASGGMQSQANAAYIAAASPDVVLAMIAKIERLEEDFDVAARSAADESVKSAMLEEEANWLAQQLLCCTDDNRVDTCNYLDCKNLCMNLGTVEGWREAARKGVEVLSHADEE